MGTTVMLTRELEDLILRRAVEHGFLPEDEASRPQEQAGDPAEGGQTVRWGVRLDPLVAAGRLDADTIARLAREILAGSAPPTPATAPMSGKRSSASRGSTRAFPVPEWERYEFVAFLGAGGMGRVFKARDPRLKRLVALKFLRDDDPELLERFLREAQAQARVEHPNVCRVYEVGEVEGVPYIAMQLIDGISLRELRERLTLEEKLLVVKQVAEALHAAHRTGLVHRDIKPANVLVETDEDGALHPYVLDFGLARQAEEPGLTMSGMVVGTAAYMAPEQARGEVHRLDRRTDVYSLGATLYELLCGRPPFEGANKVETLMKAIHEEPAPLRRLDPSVPADVETIVMTCLEKEPQRRYSSAKALAEDLRRFLDGEPIQARPASFAVRLVKKARKHRVAAASFAAASLATCVFGGIAIHARLQARLQARIAREFSADVRYVEEMLRHSYTAPLHDVRRERARVRARLQAIETRMGRLGRAAYGPGSYAIGRGHLALQEYSQARGYFERAWRAGYRPPEVAYALGQTCGALYQKALEDAERIGNREQREARRRQVAVELRDPALAYLKASSGIEVESAAYIEGLIAFYEERYDRALTLARRAFEEIPWLYEASTLEGDVELATGRKRLALGDYDGAARDFDLAGKAYGRALAVARSDADVFEGECERFIEAMGLDRRRGADPGPQAEKALAACRSAVAIDPDHAEAYDKISTVYWQWGDYLNDHGEDPQPVLNESIAMAQSALHCDKNDATAAFNLGCAHYMLGLFQMDHGQDPRGSLRAAVDSFRLAIAGTPNNAQAYNDMGYAFDRMAKFEISRGVNPQDTLSRAIAAYRKAVEIDPAYSNAFNTMGIAYWRQAEYQARTGLDPTPSLELARSCYRKALEINPKYAYACDNLGVTYRSEAHWLLEVGRDPSLALTLARDAFAKGEAINPDIYWAYADQIEVEVIAARWAIVNHRDPEAAFAAARARLLEALRRNAGSAETYQTAAELHRAQAAWRASRGRDAAGEVALALRMAEEALAINPNRAETLLVQGALYLLKARCEATEAGQRVARDRARRAFARAIELNPLLEREVAAQRAAAQ